MTGGRLGYAVSRVSHSRKTSLAYCTHTGLGLSARRRWRKRAAIQRKGQAPSATALWLQAASEKPRDCETS